MAFKTPAELQYTKSHEWIKIEGDTATVGISDYAQDAPPREIVEAVANGEIDIAIVWGPLAGYFSARSRQPLTLKTVMPSLDDAILPMTFEISMGVRKTDRGLAEELNGALERRRGEIGTILKQYGVPLIRSP